MGDETRREATKSGSRVWQKSVGFFCIVFFSTVLLSRENQHVFYLRFFLPHGIHINNKNEYFTTDVGAHLVTKWKITASNKNFYNTTVLLI